MHDTQTPTVLKFRNTVTSCNVEVMLLTCLPVKQHEILCFVLLNYLKVLCQEMYQKHKDDNVLMMHVIYKHKQIYVCAMCVQI